MNHLRWFSGCMIGNLLLGFIGFAVGRGIAHYSILSTLEMRVWVSALYVLVVTWVLLSTRQREKVKRVNP